MRMTMTQNGPVASMIRATRDDRRASRDGGVALQEADAHLAEPPLYQVVMLNDDYTPMDFVVDVLQRFFGMGRDKATRVMLAVHTEGRAICGIYTRDIAETKTMQVNRYSREHQHPLLCEVEMASGD